jgi:hypothetical protein
VITFTLAQQIMPINRVYLMSIFYGDYVKFAKSKRMQLRSEDASKNGEVVLKTTLSKENSKTKIAISDMATGIYHYEISFAGREKTIGNISVLK